MGIQYQIYTYGPSGKLLHAGVHLLGRVSEKTIRKLERKWLAWRLEYCQSHKGNYPLRNDLTVSPAIVRIYPIGKPEQVRTFKVN